MGNPVTKRRVPAHALTCEPSLECSISSDFPTLDTVMVVKTTTKEKRTA